MLRVPNSAHLILRLNYRFTLMSFRIKSTPDVFQRAISKKIQDLDGTETIIDDIIVWGTTEAEHDKRLNVLVVWARQHSLKLSVYKCEIRRSELTYVGHRFTDSGLKPDSEKSPSGTWNGPSRECKGLANINGLCSLLKKVYAQPIRSFG